MAITIDVLFERSGRSIDEVSQLARLEVARVEAILTGRWLPSPTERERLARVFGSSTEEIEWGHFMTPRNVRYHRFGLKKDFQSRPDSEKDKDT